MCASAEGGGYSRTWPGILPDVHSLSGLAGSSTLARAGTTRTRLAVKWCMWKVGGVWLGSPKSLGEAR